MDRRRKNSLTMSLVVTLCLSQYANPLQASAEENTSEEKGAQRTVLKLNSRATRGDLDAMYLLAIMHIEGAMDDADYEMGVRMLKKAPARRQADSQRMNQIMDNAISGEGC